MFLTGADFDKFPYSIPQSADAPNLVADYIPEKEKECLRSLLGSVLYNGFVSALFVDPDADPLVAVAEEDIPQKWKDLRDGAEYEYAGCTYRYDGLKNFLKPFMFSEWISDNVETLSSSGVIQSEVENGTIVSPARLISKYWAKYITYVGNCRYYRNTLWGFLKANESDYPDWLFKFPGYKNMFGL